MGTTRVGQIEFLYKLHELKREAGDDPVFAFCVDWLIEKITTSMGTEEPLPSGIAALLTPNYGPKKVVDPAERAKRVMQQLASQGTWNGAASFEANAGNSL